MDVQLVVDGGWFEEVPADLGPGGPWKYRVRVVGKGFVARAMPIVAAVGALDVQQVMLDSDAGGFSGLLATDPANGDQLRVGWADGPLVETDVVFDAGGIV